MTPTVLDSNARPLLAKLLVDLAELEDVILGFKAVDAAAINVHGRFRLDEVKRWQDGATEQMLVLAGAGTTPSGEKNAHVHVDWSQIAQAKLSAWRSSHAEITQKYRVALQSEQGQDLFWFYAHELPKGWELGTASLR